MKIAVTIELTVTNKRLFQRAAKDLAIASGASFKELPAFDNLEICALLLLGTDEPPSGCKIDSIDSKEIE